MKELGIGVIGMGWMGEAHSNAYNNVRAKFSHLNVSPKLIICSEILEERAKEAKEKFGFLEYSCSWKDVVDNPQVDVVDITAPNSMHLEIIKYCIKKNKHISCEKPLGAFPDQSIEAYNLVKNYDKQTSVGYNYRYAPLVQYAKELIEDGSLGDLWYFKGRFFASYASDELGFYSWRFEKENGYGVLSDIMSHVVDMANYLMGGIKEVSADMDTFIKKRPSAPKGASHFGIGSKDDKMLDVTNDDFLSSLVKFDSGAKGHLDTSRVFQGPSCDMSFEVYGSKGSIKWDFEEMNTLHLYLKEDTKDSKATLGYKKIYSNPSHPYHANFNPADGTGLGYEDLKTIETANFLRKILNKEHKHFTDFSDAKNVGHVLNAMLKSIKSKSFEKVEGKK